MPFASLFSSAMTFICHLHPFQLFELIFLCVFYSKGARGPAGATGDRGPAGPSVSLLWPFCLQ